MITRSIDLSDLKRLELVGTITSMGGGTATVESNIPDGGPTGCVGFEAEVPVAWDEDLKHGDLVAVRIIGPRAAAV